MYRLILTFGLLGPFLLSSAQVLDDTTKQVYGPHTTFYFTEEEVFLNRYDSLNPDTLLIDNHHFTPVQVSDFKLIDLGVLGTSIRPLFYEPPEVIGATSGFNSYDPYFRSPDEIKYYDTRSPYTLLEIILGGKGRNITDVSFSRNINPYWNAGFDVRKILTRTQIQNQGRRDRLVESTQYDFYTSFQSNDGKYHLLANFSRTNHIVDETGGVDTVNAETFFDYPNLVNRINNAQSKELMRNYHLYHQYKFWPLAQIYHRLDRGVATNDFVYEPSGTFDTTYFRPIYIDSTMTSDRLEFNTFRNEVGIKGKYNRLFYNFYYAGRYVDINYKYIDSMSLDFPTEFLEHYGGFNINLPLPGQFNLAASGEYMQGGFYKAKASINGHGLYGALSQVRYKPPVLYRAYLGNNNRWQNDFLKPITSGFDGHYQLILNKFSIKPKFKWQILDNHIYFGADSLPSQSTRSINIITGGLEWGLNFFNNIWFKGDISYTIISSDSLKAVRIPEITAFSQLYYHNSLFSNNLEFQVGGEIYWQSDYYGYGYLPTVQQFYLQDRFLIPSFPRASFFLNAKIKSARLFVKVPNVIHFVTDDSYFAAPNYVSHGKSFDFGVRWMFFD